MCRRSEFLHLNDLFLWKSRVSTSKWPLSMTFSTFLTMTVQGYFGNWSWWSTKQMQTKCESPEKCLFFINKWISKSRWLFPYLSWKFEKLTFPDFPDSEETLVSKATEVSTLFQSSWYLCVENMEVVINIGPCQIFSILYCFFGYIW